MRLIESKKQYRRLEALKHTVINDIGAITENNEVELLKEVTIKNPIGDSIGLIKKLSAENAVIEINGESRQLALSDIDADTLLSVLSQLELDLMARYFNYPKCCVEFFESGGGWTVHDVNWGGFIPCLNHKDLSLEEITKLLGRNPLTDDNLPSLKELESETILEVNYRNYILDIEDNHDGTFFWICSTLDDDGDREDVLKSSSNNFHFFFSAEEALENGKKFVDSLTI